MYGSRRISLGDLNAQIGSVMLAAQRIEALLADYGADRLMAVIAEILAATERQVRQFISGWPDGVYHGESLVDDDGFDSKLVPIRAKVTIAGDSMTIDLSESSPQVEGFINSAYANTRSLAHAAIMYLAPMDVARNEGSMRPVQIIAPRGLVVNANPPAPVCMSTNHCAEEVVEAVFKALAPAIPGAVSAGFSRRLRYAITGFDPRTEAPVHLALLPGPGRRRCLRRFRRIGPTWARSTWREEYGRPASRSRKSGSPSS